VLLELPLSESAQLSGTPLFAFDKMLNGLAFLEFALTFFGSGAAVVFLLVDGKDVMRLLLVETAGTCFRLAAGNCLRLPGAADLNKEIKAFVCAWSSSK
jgi:hypothetical protein